MPILPIVALALVTGLPWSPPTDAERRPPPTGLVASGADTTVAVTRGERLLLTGLDGELTLRAVAGDEVRIEAVHQPDASLDLRRSSDGPVYDGRGRDLSLRVEVPAWLPVVVRGRAVEIDARGLRGGLAARTLGGDVRLVDVSGGVQVSAMDGDVVAEDVSGRVSLASVDDDVRVEGARGRLSATTNDGDVILVDVEVEELEAGTTDGDVEFEGVLSPQGVYRLVTHSGDIRVTIPRDTNARVELSTFNGAFEAGFPVVLDGIRSGRRTGFTLGAGGARLILEAFDGDIVLREPRGPQGESTTRQGMR